MIRTRAACALFAGLLAVSACAAPAGPGDDRAATLAGTEWQLSELAGAPVATEAWIAFEADGSAGGTAGGNAGCNRFGGSYARDGTALVFDDIAATMMACADPGRMRAEAAFMAALEATRQATATDALLVLRDAGGAALATLTRRAPG